MRGKSVLRSVYYATNIGVAGCYFSYNCFNIALVVVLVVFCGLAPSAVFGVWVSCFKTVLLAAAGIFTHPTVTSVGDVWVYLCFLQFLVSALV